MIRENIYPISDTNGLKVFIHNQSYAQPDVFDTPISLESGKETNIIIAKTFSSSSPAPYDTCTDVSNGFSSDLYDYITSTNKFYRQKDCLKMGFQQEIQNSKRSFLIKIFDSEIIQYLIILLKHVTAIGRCFPNSLIHPLV